MARNFCNFVACLMCVVCAGLNVNAGKPVSTEELRGLLESTVAHPGGVQKSVFWRAPSSGGKPAARLGSLPSSGIGGGEDGPVFLGVQSGPLKTTGGFRSLSSRLEKQPENDAGGSDNSGLQQVDERFTTKGLREIHLINGPCGEGMCVCAKTHLAIGRTLCLPLASYYSDACLISQQCRPVDQLALCYNSRCMCDPVFSIAGISCNSSSSGLARLKSGGRTHVYEPKRSKIECMPKLRLNQTCCDSKQCAAVVDDSECNSELQTCQCKFGYVAVGDKLCMPKAYKFGDLCSVDLQCEDLTKNSNADAVCSSSGICVARCPPPLIAVPLQSAFGSNQRRKRQTDSSNDNTTTDGISGETDFPDASTSVTTSSPPTQTPKASTTAVSVKSDNSNVDADGEAPVSLASSELQQIDPQQQEQQQVQRLEQQSQLLQQRQPQQSIFSSGSSEDSSSSDASSNSYTLPPVNDYVGPVACMRAARLGEVCQNSLQCQAQEALSFCRQGQCLCSDKAIPFADRCVPPRSSDLTRLRSQILGFDSGLLAPESIFGQPRFTLRAQECCAANNFSSAQYIGSLRALQPTGKFTVKIIGNEDFSIDPETLEIFSLRPQPIVKEAILNIQAAPISGFSPPETINVFIEPASCCLRRPSGEARSTSYTASIFPGVAGADGSNCRGVAASNNKNARQRSRGSNKNSQAVIPGQASNADSMFVLRPGLFSFKHCGEEIVAYDTQVGPPDVCDLQGNVVRFTSVYSVPAGATTTCKMTATATGCNGMTAVATIDVTVVGDAGCRTSPNQS